MDCPSTEIASQESPVQPANATLLSNKLFVLTSKLGLPNAAIEGIAKKAVEILSTDGAIVPAPGHPSEAKMVISRSGKRPHLIFPKKKSGGLSCDDDCPQYKSAKLCSHTVAAAEYNHQLDQFISSYGNIKKVPNITKLATTSMPKGRGRKGSKAPSKRRPPVPIETRIELNPLSSEPITTTAAVEMDIHISPSVSTVYQPSVTAPMSVALGTSPLPSSFPATSASFPTVPFCRPTAPYSPQFPPMLSPYLSPPYTYPQLTPSSSYGPDPTHGGANPFRVHFITGNISVCNGCKRKYDKKVGPPHDLCLRHEEWRTFTPPGSTDSRVVMVMYTIIAMLRVLWLFGLLSLPLWLLYR